MDDRPIFVRDLLIPILIGGFSIFGIIVILLVGRVSASRPPAPAPPTDTPFKFIFLGTEVGVSNGTPEGTGTESFPDGEFETPTFDSIQVTPGVGTPVFVTPANTSVQGSPSNDTGGGPPVDGTTGPNPGFPTPSSAAPDPMTAGTYEDTDYRIIYDGPWSVGQGTHVSSAVGSTVTFRYIGTDWRLQYQAGPGLGTLSISVDNSVIDSLNQSDNTTQLSEWHCAQCVSYSNATHTVVLTHIGGGSVNLDKLIIPGVTTATPPTSTPTRTQTP